MSNLLDRRKQLSEMGIEVFILRGTNSKYYTEVYLQDKLFPDLKYYLEGNEYNKLLKDVIISLEKEYKIFKLTPTT